MPHFNANKAVIVEITGSGLVQGFGTANPNSEENYFDKVIATYEGRACAAIRATGKGQIRVTFHAENCPPATVEILAG